MLLTILLSAQSGLGVASAMLRRSKNPKYQKLAKKLDAANLGLKETIIELESEDAKS